MKKYIPFLLVLSFFWQSLFQSAFLGYWKYNQGEIIATKCINRFKPMMHCNGKCYLYRQLKKAADEEASNNKIPLSILKLKTMDYCVVALVRWHWELPTATASRILYGSTEPSLLQGYSVLPVKPPPAVV